MAGLISKIKVNFALVWLACCLAWGLCLGARAYSWWHLYQRSAHWERAEMAVTKAFRKFYRASGHRHSGGEIYGAKYEFTYAGRQWHGNRVGITCQEVPDEFIAICEENEQQDDIRDQIRTSIPGANAQTVHQVLGWVNPADPSESMLYRQIDLTLVFTTWFAAACTGIPILIGVFWWWWRIVRAGRQRRASGDQ